MKNNIKHLNTDDWGIDLVKHLKNDERNYRRLVNAVWFLAGVVVTLIVLHFTIINPLLNAII